MQLPTEDPDKLILIIILMFIGGLTLITISITILFGAPYGAMFLGATLLLSARFILDL